MKINQDDFLRLIDDRVYKVLLEISRRGFCLTLVGGAVRDYLLNGKLSKDLDFEIKHNFLFEEQEWQRKLDRLFFDLKNFDQLIEITKLKYCIYRIKIEGFDLEFSSARIEKLNNEKGHNYFDPVYTSNLTPKDAFERRDLTINAIGIRFGVPGSDNEFTYVDPYNGITDLNHSLLRAVSDNFFCDYVRLLRLVRFKTILGFEIVPELYDKLKEFNLSKATNHYLFYEFKKCFNSSNPLHFLMDLFLIIDEHNIETNEIVECFRPLTTIDIKDSKYDIQSDFLSWLATHKSLGEKEKLIIVQSLMLSQKKFRKLLKE